MNTERKLEIEMIVPRPIEEVFAFFAEARNLETITPPWLNFKILSQSTPQIQEGTLFEYRLRVKKIPIYWKSRIEEWNLNKSFVDTQLNGPYALWHHTHLFESVSGGTKMTDIVRYRVPLGVIGDLLAGWYVKRDVEEIFNYRATIIRQIFKP